MEAIEDRVPLILYWPLGDPQVFQPLNDQRSEDNARQKGGQGRKATAYRDIAKDIEDDMEFSKTNEPLIKHSYPLQGRYSFTVYHLPEQDNPFGVTSIGVITPLAERQRHALPPCHPLGESRFSRKDRPPNPLVSEFIEIPIPLIRPVIILVSDEGGSFL